MTEEKKTHKSIAGALASAQSEMGRAMKSATNPHFKVKYADLSSVCDACMPALNKNGIAVIQPTYDDETGRYVKTILIHGESGETLECRVPLIIQKNDMQGYGSAVTYARRYGLMGMTGIAPDDDDGTAAAKAAPAKTQPAQKDPFDPEAAAKRVKGKLVTSETLEALAERGAAEKSVIMEIKAIRPELYDEIVSARDRRRDELKAIADGKPDASDIDDEIPYQG